jgi:hypothetical protein
MLLIMFFSNNATYVGTTPISWGWCIANPAHLKLEIGLCWVKTISVTLVVIIFIFTLLGTICNSEHGILYTSSASQNKQYTGFHKISANSPPIKVEFYEIKA